MLVKRVLIPAMGLKNGRGHFRARKNEFIARPKGHIPIILSNSRSQYLSTSVLVGVSLPALLAVKLNSNLLDRRIFENYNDHY